MLFKLNLLHLALVVAAMASVYFAVRELRSRVMRASRLYSLPVTAMVMALILLLFQLAARQPAWIFAATIAAGAAIGAVRGATMKLDVDQNYRLVRPVGRRALLWVSLALPVAIAFEIGGTVAGAAGAPWRLGGAEVAILCAGMLVGRALALTFRLWRAPHVDLRR